MFDRRTNIYGFAEAAIGYLGDNGPAEIFQACCPYRFGGKDHANDVIRDSDLRQNCVPEIRLSLMSSYNKLIEIIVSETLACQRPNSPQSLGRTNGCYYPLGPYLPGKNGSYPTTDAAMSALAELADRYRSNDAALTRMVSRDSLQMAVSHVAGEFLEDIAQEPESVKDWSAFRIRLITHLQLVYIDKTHYTPVWLFLGQECAPFAIGPVQFMQRSEWLDVVEARQGQTSAWMPEVRRLWAGKSPAKGPVLAGLKAAWLAALKSPQMPTEWRNAYVEGRLSARQAEEANAERIARLIHRDQWVACTDVFGFEQEESHRRGVLATRVALDTIRLVVPSARRNLLSTASDSTVPLSVNRLSQAFGKDLARGWQFNRPGLSGSPGLATEIISQSNDLFEAAGLCIAAAVAASPQSAHPCPALADRWFNAAHWFGRACASDVDFVAIVMLVIALDVLSGGKQEQGIVELIARLVGGAKSQTVLRDGTTLKKLVERAYKLRSEMAHGSVLAVHEVLDVERYQFESLAAIAIAEYVIKLRSYGQAGGKDDRDAFLYSLPPAQP